MFDWLSFLNQHRIEYVTHGPSVTKGNVAIHCPMCGANDESHHMGISLHGKGWRCWRRPEQHKGRNPVRLVQALLGCTVTEAMRITGSAASPPSDLVSVVNSLLYPEKAEAVYRAAPKMPSTFKYLSSGLPSARPYLDYMRSRGYAVDDQRTLSKLGSLRYCSRGPWRGRIIFPLHFNQRLVSWIGRTIWPVEQLRYKALSDDPDTARRTGDLPALEPISHFLLWYDDLLDVGADTIVVVEGPFDALRVNMVASNDGIVATCLFTSTPTAEQTELLYDLLPRFRNKYLLLDNDMVPNTLRISSALISLGIEPRFMPTTIKDPGDERLSLPLLRSILNGKKLVA